MATKYVPNAYTPRPSVAGNGVGTRPSFWERVKAKIARFTTRGASRTLGVSTGSTQVTRSTNATTAAASTTANNNNTNTAAPTTAAPTTAAPTTSNTANTTADNDVGIGNVDGAGDQSPLTSIPPEMTARERPAQRRPSSGESAWGGWKCMGRSVFGRKDKQSKMKGVKGEGR